MVKQIWNAIIFYLVKIYYANESIAGVRACEVWNEPHV